MLTNFSIYDNLSEGLGKTKLLDSQNKDYYLFAKDQAEVLKDIALINKKRIRESNEFIKQLEVI